MIIIINNIFKVLQSVFPSDSYFSEDDLGTII